MLVKILSNVSYDSKVLLEGEVHEVDEKSANDFISRKIAKLEKAEVVEKPKGKKAKLKDENLDAKKSDKVEEKEEDEELDLTENEESDLEESDQD